MASSRAFTVNEWQKIRNTLDQNPGSYGLPERRYGSVVFASFNIRKLGAIKAGSGRSKATWEFLAHVCKHFDLLAVQEVLDDLDGIRHLCKLMGPEYGLLVSDKTGQFPGEPGLGERLAFIYNRRLIDRTEVATDISYDRSKILQILCCHYENITNELGPKVSKHAAYFEKLKQFANGERSKPPSKPKSLKIKMPHFLSFIRAPYCASFEVKGHPGTSPYQIMVINAHLYYGNYMSDRRQEFDALMDWLLSRLKENDKAYYPNFLLMGDLNLDYNSPRLDRKRIDKHIRTFNNDAGNTAHVNFPFLDPHPQQTEVFRTNARLSETFDQIGLFFRDPRLPNYQQNSSMGEQPTGPDYGVFNFVELFSQALMAQSFSELSTVAKKNLIARFEHRVSDHMPLWLRVPLP